MRPLPTIPRCDASVICAFNLRRVTTGKTDGKRDFVQNIL